MILWLLVILQACCFLEGKVLRSSIVKGSCCTIEQHPYIVSILHNMSPICGGSILDETTIITAAHCIDAKEKAGSFAILVGQTDLREPCKRVYTVADVKRHRSIKDIMTFDVVLLILKDKLPINGRTIKPIPLNTEKLPAGTKCVASGWGLTAGGGQQSMVLQHTVLEVLSVTDCKKRHKVGLVKDQHLCTSGGCTGTCNGDSGGPLVCNGKLSGVVSFGIPCAVGFPDAFMDLSHKMVLEFLSLHLKNTKPKC